MKGRHISKKVSRKLSKWNNKYSDMSIPQLMALANRGDEEARRTILRLCGNYCLEI